MASEYPWIGGAAHALTGGDFGGAADYLGCEPAAIQAVWEVEAAGRGYLSDGSVIRRFEPHHMPGAQMDWRQSMRIGRAQRERMFLDAYAENPEAALRAASWGAPQIMGFNAEDAGYGSAHEMVEDMALSEARQLGAFCKLVKTWGLDAALRAHDWFEFARRYNGSGQPGVYARKIEAAYRRHSGKKSPQVLRIGSRGAAVKRLQGALGIEADGAFGPQTERRVREFQERNGLAVDGVVGRETWREIEYMTGAKPKPQETATDRIADQALNVATAGIGGFSTGRAGEAVLDRAPDGALQILTYGLAGIAVLVAAVFAFKWARDTLK